MSLEAMSNPLASCLGQPVIQEFSLKMRELYYFPFSQAMELSGGKTLFLEVVHALYDPAELQSHDEKQEVQDLCLALPLPEPRGLF